MDLMLRDSKVLVTGGAGFIGSNLVESLLCSGNSVVCLDNFSTGKRENLRDFTGNPKFKLIEGNIPHSQASIEKAKKLPCYSPVLKVKEGLEEAVKWFRNNL